MNADPRLDEIHDCLYRLAIKAIIVNSDNQVLVCNEIEGWHNFPGGGLDHGESPEDGLRRELREELGLSQEELIEISTQVEFITIGLGSTNIPKVNIFYKTKIDITKITKTNEIHGTKWINPSEIPSLTWSPSLGPPEIFAENLRLVARD